MTPDGAGVPGAVFDPARVDRLLRAFGALRHTQGEWAGRPLKPDPWQVAYILAPVFGWVHEGERGQMTRIVRRLYVEVPRKNGKTTLSGGIAVYLLAADDEPGAQVYTVAAGKDQARFCFNPLKALAEHSPALSPFAKPLREKIVHRPSGSYLAVASSIGDLLHGANIHGAVIDELHVHRTADLVEAVESGTGSRRQPLVVIITTADDGRQDTIYARRRAWIEQLSRGALKDPDTYGAIWAADTKDDPFSEQTWKKANPGYGISPTRGYLRSEATKAEQSPAELASFLRLNLNIRTKQRTRYIPLQIWDNGALLVKEADLEGRECFGGLDLASTTDLCALCLDFPSGTSHDAIWRLWAPEDSLDSLNKRTAGMAGVWARQGLLRLTPGNVTDYDVVRRDLNADRARFRVREVAYDPWNASQIVNDLIGAGANMVPVRQGFASMSPGTKELQRVVREGSYRHGGHPVLRWMIDNLGVEVDAAGNVKPSRARSGDKIDGVVAAIMALDRAMRHRERRASLLGSA